MLANFISKGWGQELARYIAEFLMIFPLVSIGIDLLFVLQQNNCFLTQQAAKYHMITRSPSGMGEVIRKS